MKPSKQNRERLFRKARPVLRQFDAEDVNWLWLAYTQQGGNLPEQHFKVDALEELSGFDRLTMAEDANPGFGSGAGPVGVFHASFDDWVIQPGVTWFPWATPHNKVRSTVSYLYTLRTSKKIGVALVRSTTPKFFEGLKKYVPVYPVGRVPSGSPEGDEHWFYVRGRKSRQQQPEVI